MGPLLLGRNDESGRAVDVTMTTWGFIGSGTSVPPSPGSPWRRAVESTDVVLRNSRGPETLADLGPPSEGWRTQPDTAAYGVMYAVNPLAWDQGARPVSAVEVAQRAAASRRRHNQEGQP
jgi:hypothetical protein